MFIADVKGPSGQEKVKIVIQGLQSAVCSQYICITIICRASTVWMSRLVGGAWIETQRLLFSWKNSNLYFAPAKAPLYLYTVERLLGKTTTRKNTNILINYKEV